MKVGVRHANELMNRFTSWWIAGAGVLALALSCYPVTALTIRAAGEKGLLRAVPASTGTLFRLTWIHSVSKRPVAETYVVTADAKLCLTEMVFDHQGPGMPSCPEQGTTWRIKGGKVFVTGYSSCLDRLDIGISRFGHRLQAGTWDINLTAEIGPDRLVSVRTERTLLILIILAEVRQWLIRNCVQDGSNAMYGAPPRVRPNPGRHMGLPLHQPGEQCQHERKFV